MSAGKSNFHPRYDCHVTYNPVGQGLAGTLVRRTQPYTVWCRGNNKQDFLEVIFFATDELQAQDAHKVKHAPWTLSPLPVREEPAPAGGVE